MSVQALRAKTVVYVSNLEPLAMLATRQPAVMLSLALLAAVFTTAYPDQLYHTTSTIAPVQLDFTDITVKLILTNVQAVRVRTTGRVSTQEVTTPRT